MTTSVQTQFLEDLESCLELAEQLSREEDVETKQFVALQLSQLQKFLQMKQEQAERKIEEDIIEEEAQIEDLRDRIARLSAGEVLEGTSYENYLKMFRDLKGREWENLYKLLRKEKNEAQGTIFHNLIAILRETYDKTILKAHEAREQIVCQVIRPGDDPGNQAERQKKLRGLQREELNEIAELSKSCQVKSTPYCISSVQKTIRREVEEAQPMLFRTSGYSVPLRDAFEEYVMRCIEFSWVASFEDPKLFLVTDPKKELKGKNKKLVENFMYVDDVGRLFLVEWPAIVQGDKVISAWGLFDTTTNVSLTANDPSFAVSGDLIDEDENDFVQAPPHKPSKKAKTTDGNRTFNEDQIQPTRKHKPTSKPLAPQQRTEAASGANKGDTTYRPEKAAPGQRGKQSKGTDF
ncbi:uncharacterized protein LOC128227415 isoform X1 [Mya arenaria]|uniref:uncharacterized protein LOC128227415 isoform X1 n=1 Tax=Mya arenaria TaxID=6604 RepID=UPI0022E8F588|nr:uncharacterized protein LOC128227415 isoform X1 [Mya arenaria]XP_052793885.1 uncharacterized protein LOC128227415 isoform X1 [Mya arenaria]XP_052793886.1 uncharacterized protein LOC128227415 isoform X1 [Mya arenaria]XP_052793887.1 uncharacterized protein LOC128227415 isoform X1 [Mya arenaria]